MSLRNLLTLMLTAPIAVTAACGSDVSGPAGPDAGPATDADNAGEPKDPDTAPEAEIDRFSEAAGTLFVRNEENGLPTAGEPIDLDQGPFITRGLSPNGDSVRYYNLDVQPADPAPIYVLFREGESSPVDGQLNVVDVIPGDDGYSDFWRVHKVTVPAGYEANTITQVAEIESGGYNIEPTDTLVNCPIVPKGSTASLRGGDESTDLHRGWYEGMVVYYFTFEEDALSVTGDGQVPIAPIYVTFNTNPGEDGGGPASGFATEDGSDQTHNVLDALPGEQGYSPLWGVVVYDNADFDTVTDLASAQSADILVPDAGSVNCPAVDLP